MRPERALRSTPALAGTYNFYNIILLQRIPPVNKSARSPPEPCDASTAPTHGGVGGCPASLPNGDTCEPSCDSGYTVSGLSSCTTGNLTAATCSPNVRRAQLQLWAQHTMSYNIILLQRIPPVNKSVRCQPEPCDASTAPTNGGTQHSGSAHLEHPFDTSRSAMLFIEVHHVELASETHKRLLSQIIV